VTILEVLCDLADVEWARAGPAQDWPDQLSQPPLVVWRYKAPDERLEEAIKRAVESFRGEVEWEIYLGGRNWVIAPRRLRQVQVEGGYRVDTEAMAALAHDDPGFCEKANRDVPLLALQIKAMGKDVATASRSSRR
jgi:hypothetical protein